MTDIHSDEQAGPETTPKTVLVVDDFEGTRELFTYILRKEGYNVVTAANGAEGLKLAREIRPTAIILDVIMPEMDGWTVLQHLKGDPELADIPVLMATVLEEQSKGYVLGATDYLTKPLDRKKLVTILDKYLRDREAGPILIVEDDEGTREITSYVLEKEGWQVQEATDGLQALERLIEQRPQLILLDLVMPEMDGFEFIDELYRNPEWRTIPVVVVTARELTPEEGRYLNERVERVMQKGTHSRDDLMDTIRALVKSSSDLGA